jgi:hypothetical protein
MSVNPAVCSSSTGVGTAGWSSQYATWVSDLPRGGGEEQGAQQVLGGRPPQVLLVRVIDGEHEMPGQPVRVLHRGQPMERVPPPTLLLVGDVLRIEQPHRAARLLAKGGGGGPQIGLVAGGDDRARRRQHVRDHQVSTASNLPYRETTDPDYAATAATTFIIEDHGIGLRLLRGRCPRCAAAIDIPVVRQVVKGSGQTVTASTSAIEPVLCTCDETHDGRPEGRVGCGAYWNFTL